jgi:hypothetical protein
MSAPTVAPPPWPLPGFTAKRAAAERRVAGIQVELADARTAVLRRRLSLALERIAAVDRQFAEQRQTERLLWAGLWAAPQAAEWRRLGCAREVATYVRHRVLGELGNLGHAQEARMQADRLGLTPRSLARLSGATRREGTGGH